MILWEFKLFGYFFLSVRILMIKYVLEIVYSFLSKVYLFTLPLFDWKKKKEFASF